VGTAFLELEAVQGEGKTALDQRAPQNADCSGGHLLKGDDIRTSALRRHQPDLARRAVARSSSRRAVLLAKAGQICPTAENTALRATRWPSSYTA
jgi:hypothetical protein